MWSYDYEISRYSQEERLMAGFISFGGPLHDHKGYIALSNDTILIEGKKKDEDKNIVIPLISIKEIYLGYDEVYIATSVKNAGLFWQPLRIEYYDSHKQLLIMYLIIDYNGIYTHNKKWYEKLTTTL